MLSGKKVLITAGPTIEPIDPVRFISNHSTGKMGYALAEAFAGAGADVLLISGPTALQPIHKRITLTNVNTADQMYAAVHSQFRMADVMVFAAAVADYKPRNTAAQKIKKNDETLTLELVKNVDIAASIGQMKLAHQFTVGFALETENEAENAVSKLHKKNFDMIVLNSLSENGAGFGHDTNRIRILDARETIDFDLKSKTEVARDIVATVINRLYA